jgi:hypothetical protein
MSSIPKLSFTSKNKKDVKLQTAVSQDSKPSAVQSLEDRATDKKSKIGTYSSAEFQNWLNTPIQKTKMKRSKRTNDDAFQIFNDFSEKVENNEWKLFFQKLYTGKFPHGYSFRNQTLFFRKRTKIEKLDIQDANQDTLSKVMNFFEIYGGFTNSDDNLNIFDYIVSNVTPYRSWKDIRSKKTKQFFIHKYVDELVIQYQLSHLEKRYLLDTIHTGFLIRSIDSSDIDFQDKRIVNIKTLHWNGLKREFELVENVRNQRISRKNTSEKLSKNSYSAHWTKFLSQIIRNKSNEDDMSTDVSYIGDDLTDTTLSFSITE